MPSLAGRRRNAGRSKTRKRPDGEVYVNGMNDLHSGQARSRCVGRHQGHGAASGAQMQGVLRVAFRSRRAKLPGLRLAGLARLVQNARLAETNRMQTCGRTLGISPVHAYPRRLRGGLKVRAAGFRNDVPDRLKRNRVPGRPASRWRLMSTNTTANILENKLIPVRVRSLTIEAEGVRSIDLVAAGGETLPPWTPGAHIEMLLPGGLARHYSLFNGPEETDCYRIAVKLEPSSRGGSSALHDHCRRRHLADSRAAQSFPAGCQGKAPRPDRWRHRHHAHPFHVPHADRGG